MTASQPCGSRAGWWHSWPVTCSSRRSPERSLWPHRRCREKVRSSPQWGQEEASFIKTDSTWYKQLSEIQTRNGANRSVWRWDNNPCPQSRCLMFSIRIHMVGVGGMEAEFSQMPPPCKWYLPHVDFQTGLTPAASMTHVMYTKIHIRKIKRNRCARLLLKVRCLFYWKEQISFQRSPLEEWDRILIKAAPAVWMQMSHQDFDLFLWNVQQKSNTFTGPFFLNGLSIKT